MQKIKKFESYNINEGKASRKLIKGPTKPNAKIEKKVKLDYHDMMKYLEEKYDFESRGFTGIPSTIPDRGRHFYNWCDKHDLPEIDEEGKHRGSSQIFFKQYNAAEDGEKVLPPYMDFWHYLADYNEDSVRNGGYIHIPRKADTSKEESVSPEKMISSYEWMLKEYPKDKEIQKNAKELIRRAKEEIKNPKVDPWKGWKQQITDLIFKEFGEYAVEDPDYLKVWVEW